MKNIVEIFFLGTAYIITESMEYIFSKKYVDKHIHQLLVISSMFYFMMICFLIVLCLVFGIIPVGTIFAVYFMIRDFWHTVATLRKIKQLCIYSVYVKDWRFFFMNVQNPNIEDCIWIYYLNGTRHVYYQNLFIPNDIMKKIYLKG